MRSRITAIAMLVIAMCVSQAVADDPPTSDPQQDERAVIQQRAQSYVDAYNAKDMQALFAHWAPAGVYIDRASGQRVVGHEALKAAFQTELDSRQESRLEIAIEAIEFVSPSVAMEQGTSTITSPNAEPVTTGYSAVHVKRDGQWLIDRVSEREIVAPPSHYEQLKPLEWMIGDWTDQAGEGVVSTQCQWSRNNNFIIRSFTVAMAGAVEMAGLQIVGWDPATEQIRSWVFDSDGGFNQGVWEQTGDRWSVRQTATLPGGALASSTTLLTPLDDNTFTWQQVNRVVDGQLLPNLAEVVIRRN